MIRTTIRATRAFARLMAAPAALALLATAVWLPPAQAQPAPGFFNRVVSYPVYLNNCAGQPSDCIDDETVAEIVTATADGMTLAYTDGANDSIGFLDISDPSAPTPAGVVNVGGETTSVAITRDYAIAGVNTSESFTEPSGELVVIDIDTLRIVRRIDLPGQPDSVDVSPNNRYAAIVIENERNEDIDVGGVEGGLPQLPAGSLVIADINGPVSRWSTRTVSLTGLADIAPSDPEPEFVDINRLGLAVVTMQENNHAVIIRVSDGSIVNDFNLGTVDLDKIDTSEEDVITFTSSLSDVPREPDAVAWISPFEFATADEGDFEGGSRGFTIFNINGGVRFTSGNEMEHLVGSIGHYPENRSGNKGNEPEGIAYARYGSRRILFVGSERSSVIAVYEIPANGGRPEFVQVLPAGIGPEGLLPIPSRDLFVVSSEVDEREETIRSSISIYELQRGDPTYPTIMSVNRPGEGTPIPWGALSALTNDPIDTYKAYAVEDSFYAESRIFELDMSETPAKIVRDIPIVTSAGAPLSIDPEGIAISSDGKTFYVASEGRDSCSEVGVCDVRRKNIVFVINEFGVVQDEIRLPQAVDDIQRNNGFEGVALTGSGADTVVWVAFQREWNLVDPAGWARIGRYELATDSWSFYYYPLSRPTSPNGGWVGLSEITSLGGGRFAVIERDNQAGPDARIKTIYEFSTSRVAPLAHEDLPTDPDDENFPALTKRLVRDILPDLEAPGGLAIEKVEGLMELLNGDVYFVTDNDGTDDSSGETQLINVGPIF